MEYISVDDDRYSGVYSGALFTAWVGDVPEDVSGGDGLCEEFWDENTILCGKGDSAVLAVQDLLQKIDRWVGSFDLVDTGRFRVEKDERFLLVWTDKFDAWWPEDYRDQ